MHPTRIHRFGCFTVVLVAGSRTFVAAAGAGVGFFHRVVAVPGNPADLYWGAADLAAGSVQVPDVLPQRLSPLGGVPQADGRGVEGIGVYASKGGAGQKNVDRVEVGKHWPAAEGFSLRRKDRRLTEGVNNQPAGIAVGLEVAPDDVRGHGLQIPRERQPALVGQFGHDVVD